MSAKAQAFWMQWVEDSFPDFDSRAYFLPPVYFNRVPMTRQSIAGQNVSVLQSPSGQPGQSNQKASVSSAAAQASIPQPTCVLHSDVRDDAAMQHVLVCLQKMAEQHDEVLFGMTQLQFGQYLREPCYAAAAAQLPLPVNLPPALPRNWKQGDFDFLVIHRLYGLIVCEVKAFGDNVKALNMSQQDVDKNIRKKLTQAVSQLDKAEAMLSHLVSDIAPGLRITKTIAVPNLTACQIQQAVCADTQLTQGLCRCLGTADPADITGLCICSDQLSDPKTPWDVSSDVLRELGNWWQRRVAGAGPDSHMTSALYKTLVARFCGPATTVTVPCTTRPRLTVKTLSEAVSATGEFYSVQITLFPDQVNVLNTGPPLLSLCGPPGTGKTVMLLLKGREWLQCGHDVIIVSPTPESRAACRLLYNLLLTAEVRPGQLYLLEYDFAHEQDVEIAANDLSLVLKRESMHLIAEEWLCPNGLKNYVKLRFLSVFLENWRRLPHLHIWSASCYSGATPPGWKAECLTRPLRCPPAVVREVERDSLIVQRAVEAYSERAMPDYTDGPPVRRLYHRGQRHSGDRSDDCVTCGRELGSFLHSLRVGAPANTSTTSTTVTIASGTSPPLGLQWRDVLVLSVNELTDDSGVVTGLAGAGIPVRVMTDDDADDVALACSDVVWATIGDRVRGLERKVVVCLECIYSRLYNMSRSTSQLVIVSNDD